MSVLKQNYNLKSLNTFGIKAKASSYFSFETVDELKEFCSTQNLSNFLILGGGSNLLFTKDFEGTVIHPQNKKITILKETSSSVFIEAEAGVDWDFFVNYCVNHNFYGAENLSLIPGNVGASPVQNIGAYGIEAKDIIHQVKGYKIDSKSEVTFTNEECSFSYRNSIFKTELKNKIIITSVIFKLKKEANLNIDYGSVKSEVEKLGEPSLQNIRKAIISIRESKLPDHTQIGNAGSFFKNPVVDTIIGNAILSLYPEAPHYLVENNMMKIPAGWLIEKCGWKGKSIGQAGVHKDQALVIINKGGATGQEVIHLAHEIEKSVKEKFNIQLEKEVIEL